MNQYNQGNNSNPSPGIPLKRKRGRPRKDQSLNRVEISRVPPGLERVNGNRPRQVGPINGANDGMVGQVVTGVVEAVFDAGYLLAVRIGNSNTCLRGVVLKTGHYAPVTEENDVAPHLPMIRRNETHLPTDQTRGLTTHTPRSGERNEQHANYLSNGSPRTGTLVFSKGKYAPPVLAPSVPPVGARGTVVPVVLQPVNLSNGLLPANQVTSSAQAAALKGKHVQTAAPPLAVYPSNGSTLTDPVLAIASQTLNPQATPKSVKIENGPLTLELRQGEEAKSMKSTDEVTSGEVIKGGGDSSQLSEMYIGYSKAACDLSLEDSGNLDPERESSDTSETLSIEPLQTVHSDHHNESASIAKTPESNRAGRMTELLLAMQENMTENQFPSVPPGYRF